MFHVLLLPILILMIILIETLLSYWGGILLFIITLTELIVIPIMFATNVIINTLPNSLVRDEQVQEKTPILEYEVVQM